ncbi:MAG: tetratricopeptide repeat protein [Polaromonas sp.]|nr:tetratricopeptide repeat protein [Polaromonas sp.]
MSLLLEALRRAEEEAQKNKPTGTLAATTPAKHDAPAPSVVLTHRQAMSAAGVMAGSRPRTNAGAQPWRKGWLVLAVAMVFPLAALVLYGDVLVASVGMLTTAPTAAIIPATLPISLPASLPELTTPDSAATTAVMAVLAAAPVAEPLPVPAPPRPAAQRTPRTRLAATAPPPEVSDKPTAAPTGPSLSLTASAPKPDALMASAYAAYQAGNTAEAGRLYRLVLKADVTQRDAWLGLAVMAHADGQREPALDAYKRVLRLEPQNPTALAGIHSLSRQAGEPMHESRLRDLLARSPEEPDLNHALGLLLSGAQRWSEAQPLFFKAHQLVPLEPRFAYNLAVTLDHLRKPSLARQYYEAALVLAQDSEAGFDEPSARSRVLVLRAGATETRNR